VKEEIENAARDARSGTPKVRPARDAKAANRNVGVSGGRSLTGPLPPIPLGAMVPRTGGATRTPLGFGICPSFKGSFCRAVPKPNDTIRDFSPWLC
jgi:hypothetical protein